MTVLPDHMIRDEVQNGGVNIEPYDERNLQPASYDLRLGKEMYHVGSDSMSVRDTHELKPFERYLGHTKETISLPSDISGQVSGRSSIGRKGVIVHKTAGWIDPKFTGEITLEIMNMGKEPIELKSGNRVAQIILFRLESRSSGYDGKYQNQSGPTTFKPDTCQR
jgi:dCTP deaminase